MQRGHKGLFEGIYFVELTHVCLNLSGQIG